MPMRWSENEPLAGCYFPIDRRSFLAAVPALPVAVRIAARPPEPWFATEYTVASFSDAEGWLLFEDDDVAGNSDWKGGVLTYDFRAGATYVGIANRLDAFRGRPDAVVLLGESDGGGRRLAIRLRDRTGQYFQTTIARLDRPGALRAMRTLHDLDGPAWTVFGGPADHIVRPPLTVAAILMTTGPGRRTGTVWLRRLRVRTRLQRADGLRLDAAPVPARHGFTLTVENLLPTANEVTLAYGLVGLAGASLARGIWRLGLSAGGQATRFIPVPNLASSPTPPVVQVAAQATARGAVVTAQASLVRGADILVPVPLAGMGVHAALSSRVLPREMGRLARQVADCGVRWVREDFNWQQLSPVGNRVSVRRLDRAIDAARSAGLRVLGLPTAWPAWTHPYTARGVSEFTKYLRTIATRYRGKVDAWEIWNEPNLPLSWRGSAEQYVELLAASYATLKEVDPGVLVVGPCAAGPGDLSNPASVASLAWIERVLNVRRPLFDVFSFHPYEGRRSPEAAGLTETVGRLQRMVQASGHPSRIWITEQGWASDYRNPTIDDLEQARLLIRAYLLSRIAGVENYFWYDARNDGLSADDHEDNYGLLRRDFSEKASYQALAVLASVLGDWHVVEVPAAPPGLFAVRSAPSGTQPAVLALWSPGQSRTVSIALHGQGGSIRDLDGAVTPLPVGMGQVRLPMGLVRFIIGDVELSSSSL